MKTKKWRMHAIFTCETCGESWEDFRTAAKEAYAHARKHKHYVSGEVGYAVKYDGRDQNDERSN
jgi:hypothetical protein